MSESKSRPAHEIRFGSVKVVIWKNTTANGHMFNVTVARIYKDNGDWKESSGFGLDDLLVLAKALHDAFAWIHAERTAEHAKSA